MLQHKQGITPLTGVLSLTLISLLSLNVAAQTCNDNISYSTPTDRFSINSNATVTDKQTGLIWKRCLEGQTGTDCSIDSANTMNWQDALQQAANSTFAGLSDWRLPNIKELSSIVELRCYEPAINLTLFPEQPSSSVWTGSPLAADSIYAWDVNFNHGYDDFSGRSVQRYVRLVRGGQ